MAQSFDCLREKSKEKGELLYKFVQKKMLVPGNVISCGNRRVRSCHLNHAFFVWLYSIFKGTRCSNGKWKAVV